jgi:hypothetical protein
MGQISIQGHGRSDVRDALLALSVWTDETFYETAIDDLDTVCLFITKYHRPRVSADPVPMT